MRTNIRNNSNATLSTASINGHSSIIKFLVEHGVDIYDNINAALWMLRKFDHGSVVKFLLEHG